MSYTSRKAVKLTIKNSMRDGEFDSAMIGAAVLRCNKTMSDISRFEVNIFEILGMRNLSAFVGEVFAASMATESDGLFIKNPHQDGYPDLLLLDNPGAAQYGKLSLSLREKAPFSPFISGGIEIKATVGSTPSPSVLAKKALHKPEIGDQRIDLLNSYDWKAHHRETNNLLGILWDFADGIPCIAAVFYSSTLTSDDWGKIVQPKDGGGRTTSVSIMTKGGLKKMYEGWQCITEDSRYGRFLNKKNKSTLIPVREI